MIQFLPEIKKFISKPFKYIREKGQGFETILSFLMVRIFIKFVLLA